MNGRRISEEFEKKGVQDRSLQEGRRERGKDAPLSIHARRPPAFPSGSAATASWRRVSSMDDDACRIACLCRLKRVSMGKGRKKEERTEQPRCVTQASPLAVRIVVRVARVNGTDEEVALHAEDGTGEGRVDVGKGKGLFRKRGQW
jgi:hypothetical protein